MSGGAFSTPNSPVPTITHMSVIDSLIALNPSATANAIEHLILPAIALAFINMGIATRMTRTVGDTTRSCPSSSSDRRMKGLGEFLVLYKHALRNALITTGHRAGGDGRYDGTRYIRRRIDLQVARPWASTRTMRSRGTTSPVQIGVVIFFADRRGRGESDRGRALRGPRPPSGVAVMAAAAADPRGGQRASPGQTYRPAPGASSGRTFS